MPKIIVITGQTATGKTSRAIREASRVSGEMINCDSRQLYRGMDIITGKDLTGEAFHHEYNQGQWDIGWYPVRSDRHTVPIWLYDIARPDQQFSSHDYVECAIPLIKRLIETGKTPLITGGTYLYLYHLLYGMESEGIAPDTELREALNLLPVATLQDKLQALSPELYESMNDSDKHNPHRLIRKIELAHHDSRVGNTLQFDYTIGARMGINNLTIEINGLRYTSREALRKAIEVRVHERISRGGLDEVKKLIAQGYDRDSVGMQTIGYKQLFAYMRGEISEAEAVSTWITREMQYAKRQMTFMKRDPHIIWSDIT